MADVQWIRLTTNMFDNRKIKHLRKLPEGNNIVLIWVMLLTMAGRCNASGMIFLTENIPYTTKMLADELEFEENIVILALQVLEQFEMIVRNGDLLIISGWEEHQNADGLEKIREQTRKRVARHRENQKLLLGNATCNVTVTDCNATEEEIEEEIEKEDIKKHSASDNAPSKKDISEFFEKIWLLYPCKKGKGQVSDSKKKTLYNIGLEEMTRAIERYKSDLAKEDWRKPQNGSTFFNSGYVDYLDANYTPLEPRKQKRNAFNNFEGRKYDMQALERMLTEQKNFKPETDPEFLAEAEALKRELDAKYKKEN